MRYVSPLAREIGSLYVPRPVRMLQVTRTGGGLALTDRFVRTLTDVLVLDLVRVPNAFSVALCDVTCCGDSLCVF